jgi:hypothetical protein
LAAEARDGSKRRFVWMLAAVLVAAAVVRALLIVRMGPQYYFADTLEYEAAARSLLAGHGLGAGFPRAPLYPGFMALGFALFGVGNYMAVRWIQLGAGLLIVALSMRLGARLAGRPGAVLAGAGAATAPTLIFTTSMLYPTVFYTLLLLAMTLAVLGLDERPGRARAVLLGLIAFLLWMTDQVALAPIAAVLLWLVGRRPGPSRTRVPGPSRAGAVAIAVLTAVALAVPWVVARERAGGSAFFMEKAQIVLYYARTDPQLAGARAVRDTSVLFHPLTTPQFVAREWRLLREQPVPYASDYVREYVHFFQPMPDRITTQNAYTSSGAKLITALYFLPVLLLATIGLLLGAGSGRARRLLALIPLATAALYALFFTQMRYRIPTEPEMLVLAALGFARLFPRFAAAPAPPSPATSPTGPATP